MNSYQLVVTLNNLVGLREVRSFCVLALQSFMSDWKLLISDFFAFR